MATLTFAQTRWWAARFRLRPVLAGDAPCSQSLQSAYLTALSKVRPLRGMVFFNACVKDDRCDEHDAQSGPRERSNNPPWRWLSSN